MSNMVRGAAMGGYDSDAEGGGAQGTGLDNFTDKAVSAFWHQLCPFL